MTRSKIFVLFLLIGLTFTGYLSFSRSVTQNSVLSGNSYTINVLNKTKHTVFVYIDKELAFAVEPGKSKTGYMVDNPKEIYATTFNKKLKWGPIDLKKQKKDFYWKIVEKEKKEMK